MRRTNIGGQGVLEGVMMRSETMSALAVRKSTGEIVLQKTPVSQEKKKWYQKVVVVRGIYAFFDTMFMGVKTLMDSAKLYDEDAPQEKPSKFEEFIAKKTGKDPMNVMMAFAVLIAVGLCVLLFFLLPTFLASLFKNLTSSTVVLNLIEGLIRIIIFILYIVGVSYVKDIKRVFMYHGAEHKTLNCYEHEGELKVEEIQTFKTLHPRCGTSYLFFIILIPILLFSLIDWSNLWYIKLASRILLLPLIAGLAYELLKYAAKKDTLIFRILRWPGMQMQKITTKPPTDDMVEVALVAFTVALNQASDDEIHALIEKYDRSPKKEIQADQA